MTMSGTNISYHGSLEALQNELHNIAKGYTTWEEVARIPHGYQFKCSIGGVVNWFPSTGKLVFLDKFKEADILRKLWETRAHVDADGYGEVFTTYMENHGGRIQVCNQMDGRYQLQVTRAACNVSVILTVGEIKGLIKELGRCTGEQG